MPKNVSITDVESVLRALRSPQTKSSLSVMAGVYGRPLGLVLDALTELGLARHHGGGVITGPPYGSYVLDVAITASDDATSVAVEVTVNSRSYGRQTLDTTSPTLATELENAVTLMSESAASRLDGELVGIVISLPAVTAEQRDPVLPAATAATARFISASIERPVLIFDGKRPEGNLIPHVVLSTIVQGPRQSMSAGQPLTAAQVGATTPVSRAAGQHAKATLTP